MPQTGRLPWITGSVDPDKGDDLRRSVFTTESQSSSSALNPAQVELTMARWRLLRLGCRVYFLLISVAAMVFFLLNSRVQTRNTSETYVNRANNERLLVVTHDSGSLTFVVEMLREFHETHVWQDPLIGKKAYGDGSSGKLNGELRMTQQVLSCDVGSVDFTIIRNVFMANMYSTGDAETNAECIESNVWDIDNGATERHCRKILQLNCIRKHLIVMTTSHLRLSDAQILLEEDPQLKVIYYVRDPRAVIATRQLGHHLSNDVAIDQARDLCRQMSENYEISRLLVKYYPGRFNMIRKEWVAQQPKAISRQIFKMFHREPPTGLNDWLQSYTSKGGLPVYDDWNAVYNNAELLTHVKYACENVLSAFSYD